MTPSTETGSGVVGELRTALEHALRPPADAPDRLAHADTTVRMMVADRRESVTLLLDRTPSQVAESRSGTAEVTLHLSEDQARAFLRGALPMPAAVAGGAVQAEGPVRRYLEVDAILRERLCHLHASEAVAPPADTPRRLDGPIASELLALETFGLHKQFGQTKVLRGLDLQVPEGVISVVLGPSGTGKSVLLQHIVGSMEPDAGDVAIRGRRLSTMSRKELLRQRREIGVMFQDGALFSSYDVYDNVAYPLRRHTDLSEREIRENVERHLSDVGLLGAAHRMPGELSGGMRKRAGLARALALDPGIILCDEPDSGLDPVRTALLGDLLADRHADHGGTMLVVTHNIALARAIGDHISVLHRGQVVEAGFADTVLRSDHPFIRQFITGAAVGPLTMDA